MSQELRPFNSQGSGGRSDRLSVLAFVNDSPTEQVIRDGLSDIVANGIEIRRGGIRSAINAMGKLQTPEVLIVDLSSEEQPLKSLNELADLVEPGVRILTIGNTDDVEFYRQIIREVGVLEYIFKPITRESVARHFAPLISKKTANSPALDSTRGGRVISIIGARGGVGATTIATNLAWYLGAISKRHSVYLESEMHMASGATMLGSTAGIGLKVALEFPDQINALFLEQAAVPVSERLHVISNEERIGTSINYTPGAGKKLIDALRVRYNFIVLDVPLVPEPYNIEMINHAHHRVIVMDPSLASIRDTLRLLAVPNGT
jgi:pilus assembly protein CpaE